MESTILEWVKDHATQAEWARLKYLARRIKARTATPAEVSEYRLVLTIAADVAL